MADVFKSIFESKRTLFLLLAAVAVGGVLLCVPTAVGTEKAESSSSNDELAEYKLKLEEELANICSMVVGVGRCKVVVSFERGAENVYKGSQLVESTPPKVSGVSIVCEGGSNQVVRSTLVEMISSLFGIGKNRIAVLELEK